MAKKHQDTRAETEPEAQRQRTRRSTVDALEAIMNKPIAVLDHGFIRVVDYMGDDSAIVQAARVSYGKGTKKSNEDEGLIRYLMRHRHTTPFEMCEIKLHVKLPIFVARQWIRHRTASVNEYSARYSVLDSEFYVPATSALAGQSKTNKQGRAGAIPDDEAKEIVAILQADAKASFERYHWLLNEDEAGERISVSRSGLAREMARINLPLSAYTQWYWKIDLHNLLHFIQLRVDSHAQHEIRAYAEVLRDIVRAWVPMAHKAFLDYRVNGAFLSAQALHVVKSLASGREISQADSGLSPGEWRELQELIKR